MIQITESQLFEQYGRVVLELNILRAEVADLRDQLAVAMAVNKATTENPAQGAAKKG